MKTGQFAAVKLGHEATGLMLGFNRKSMKTETREM